MINYEFPEFISDYIHRVGRVGRVGSSPGFVLNFVTYKWDVELLWKIEVRPLHVPRNIRLFNCETCLEVPEVPNVLYYCKLLLFQHQWN